MEPVRWDKAVADISRQDKVAVDINRLDKAMVAIIPAKPRS